jgi:hypothetical protein
MMVTTSRIHCLTNRILNIRRTILSLLMLGSLFGFSQKQNISNDSLDKYFRMLPEDSLFSINQLTFMLQHNKSSRTLIYKFVSQNRQKINNVFKISFAAEMYLGSIIGSEGIDSQLWKNGDLTNAIAEVPDWQKIENNIIKTYGKRYVERPILDAKVKWYEYKKDYANQIKFTIQQIERDGPDTSGFGRIFLNNTIYELIFMHGVSREYLAKGLIWMKLMIDSEKPGSNHYDTYANLLYKSGRTQEAIFWEEMAVDLDHGNPELLIVLEKMKRGEKTWVQ